MLKPRVEAEMNDLQEFYDPDTVGKIIDKKHFVRFFIVQITVIELMHWIGNNTESSASFAGSMQLLAGVKCCTGRHLTNHPHYEDKWLRERTKQVLEFDDQFCSIIIESNCMFQ